MRRIAILLPLLAACSVVSQYRTTIDRVREWQTEAAAMHQSALRYEFQLDQPAVKIPLPPAGCAALMSQQYREADACEGELHEMGDGCKIPGACPNCEAMVQTVAQYKADRCVL